MELSPVNHLLWLRTCAPFDLRNVPFLWMQQKCWRSFSVCLLHVSTGSIHSETHGTHLCGASSFLLLLVQTFLHCFVCWFSIFMFPFEITFCASRSPLDIGTNIAAWRRIRKEPQHNIGLIQRFLFVSFSGCLIPHFCFSFFLSIVLSSSTPPPSLKQRLEANAALYFAQLVCFPFRNWTSLALWSDDRLVNRMPFCLHWFHLQTTRARFKPWDSSPISHGRL